MSEHERSVWTGRRRRVTVTIAGVARVGETCEQVSGVPARMTYAQRASSWIRREGPRLVRWALALVVGVLITQYAARYYSNRQQAIELRASVIETINGPSVHVYNDALGVVSAAIQGHSETALRTQRNKVVNAWIEASASVDATVIVHFEHTSAKHDWHRFQRAVYELVALSHANALPQAEEHIEQLRAFLRVYHAEPDLTTARWKALLCRTEGCRGTTRWYESYRWLGNQIMFQRYTIMLSVLHSHVENLG